MNAQQTPFKNNSFDSSAFEAYLRATGRGWYKMNSAEQTEAIKQYRAEAARRQQNDLDLIAANRQVCAMQKAIKAYESECADCPEELPGGYFRALELLKEWEDEVSRLRKAA